MSQSNTIQLNLWDWLEEASQAVKQMPHLVAVQDGITALESVMNAIIDEPVAAQLSIAAEALSQLSTVLNRKSEEWLTDWEQGEIPGITLPDDWTVGLVRQSVSFDLSSLVEAPEPPFKSKRIRPSADSSIAAPVDAERLLTLLEQLYIPPDEVQRQLADLAGGESPTQWRDRIAHCIQQHQRDSPITFAQLQQLSGLATVELWLGLLLNGYSLKPVQPSSDEFYQTVGSLLIVN